MFPFTFAVIIHICNRETMIGETITNVLWQNLPLHEIIVMGNRSTDGL